MISFFRCIIFHLYPFSVELFSVKLESISSKYSQFVTYRIILTDRSDPGVWFNNTLPREFRSKENVSSSQHVERNYVQEQEGN